MGISPLRAAHTDIVRRSGDERPKPRGGEPRVTQKPRGDAAHGAALVGGRSPADDTKQRRKIAPGPPETPGADKVREPVPQRIPRFTPERLRADQLDAAKQGDASATERRVADQLERLERSRSGRDIAERLRTDKVTIEVTDDPDVYGSYAADPPKITINADLLAVEDTLLKVLAHEGRHHQQAALGIDDDINRKVGEGSGEGSDRSDGVEADATLVTVRVARELGIDLNDDEAKALRADGSGRTLQELVDLRRSERADGPALTSGG